jgi:hypothetical protein
LPFAGQRAGHLPHARILRARIRIHLLQQLYLSFESCGVKRVDIAVQLYVSTRGRRRHDAGIALRHGAHGLTRAADCRFGQFRRMRISGRFACHGTQAEALRGVECRGLQTAVVEDETLALAVLQKQLAIV